MRKPGSASNLAVWPKLNLPRKITSAAEFETSVLKIRRAYTGVHHGDKRFLNLMYYFLGWLVGDAGKNFSDKHSWARIQLDLSRKHPQNLPLGNFVMNCVSMLGITCGRIADRRPGKRDPHGLYRWMSYFSEVFVWFHTSCLGLELDQLTSYDSVKMDWLKSASREHIIWFLRGIADSDGNVNVRNRTVEITSEPNTDFFKTLLESLGIKAWTHVSDGVGYVAISSVNAARIAIFNPEVETHRGLLLGKLASAKTFPRKWPAWLERRASRLLSEGLSLSAVRDRLLFEDETYVKLKTLKTKLLHERE